MLLTVVCDICDSGAIVGRWCSWSGRCITNIDAYPGRCGGGVSPWVSGSGCVNGGSDDDDDDYY